MIRNALALASMSLFFVGCSPRAWDAPYDAVLAEMEDIRVAWFGCKRNATTGELENPSCENSPPVILRLDARVIDEETDVPLNNVRIWWTSGYSKIYLVPPEVLEAIEVPNTSGWDAVTAADEVFAEFSGEIDGDYRPTYFEGATDTVGVSSVYAYIEEMPLNTTGTAVETGIQICIAPECAILKLQGGQ